MREVIMEMMLPSRVSHQGVVVVTQCSKRIQNIKNVCKKLKMSSKIQAINFVCFRRLLLMKYMSKPHQTIIKMTAMIRATIINYRIQSSSGTKTSLPKKHHFLVRFGRLPPP